MSSFASSVVSVGSCIVDVSVEVAHLPSAGESLVAKRVMTAIGGKASNIAMGVVRLNASAHIVVCLGDDHWADEAIELWRSCGVDVSGVMRQSDSATGLGIVCVSSEGENFTVSALGANHSLDRQHIDASRRLFEQADVCTIHLNAPVKTVVHTLQVAAAAGCITVLNASPVQNLSDHIYSSADVVVVNALEAERLTAQRIGTVAHAIAAGRVLRGRGCHAVVITLGEAGAVAVSAEGSTARSYQARCVRDTTGAGDAFVAALSVELARGEPLEAALDFAVASGAASVENRGTWTSMPTRAEVEDLRLDATGR